MVKKNRLELVNFAKLDYFKIRDSAWLCLIKNKFNTLPIDLNIIAENNNWLLLPYEDNELLSKTLDRRNYTTTCFGWTCIYKDKDFNIKIIFYKHTGNVGQQRFTIAHELGHLALVHLIDLDNQTYEKEANMFAARILMPIGILHKCKITSAEQIKNLCGVTITAATFRYERYQMLLRRNMFETSNLERKLIRNFRRYIKNHKIS